jgi:hypothetical protein
MMRNSLSSRRFLTGNEIGIPACIPVYDGYSPVGGDSQPTEYIYLSDQSACRRGLVAYIIQQSEQSPHIEQGDIVLLDRNKAAGADDTVACFIGGKLYTGSLRRYGPELCLENNVGEFLISWDQLAGVIIGVEKRKGIRFNTGPEAV